MYASNYLPILLGAILSAQPTSLAFHHTTFSPLLACPTCPPHRLAPLPARFRPDPSLKIQHDQAMTRHCPPCPKAPQCVTLLRFSLRPLIPCAARLAATCRLNPSRLHGWYSLDVPPLNYAAPESVAVVRFAAEKRTALGNRSRVLCIHRQRSNLPCTSFRQEFVDESMEGSLRHSSRAKYLFHQ